MPPQFLEEVVILPFEKRYPKEYTVARLKSNIWPQNKYWAGSATEPLYRCITCQRCLRSKATCGKAH